jgi:type I restriction enzyme S subunit
MREDWTECILDDLLVLMTNGSSAKQFEEEVGLPISRIETIWNEKIDFERVKYIKESEPDFIEKYQILKNDILLSHINSDSHLGKTAIYKNENKVFIHGINLLRLRPSLEINADYLLHQFRFKKIKGDFIAVAQRAVNQSSINQRKLKGFDFIIAPLPEQRAIVAKIEELFSDLDKGIADLKKAQDQLKVYRQAVLKKAFEGELTKEKVEPEIIKLGSVIDKPRYGTSKKCSLEPNGIAVLRIPNIGNGLINPEELKYAEFDAKEISTLKLQEGDILTIRSNGSVDLVGKCALITQNDVDYLYAGYLIRLRPDKELIDSKFLLYGLKSHDLRVQIESKAKSTSGVNNINSGELANLRIPHFQLKIQHQIVRQIESRLSVCDKVEQSITESLEKAKALRQSILKKAFAGTLLSQEEIAACKAALDYEPAGVLLERIKAEKKEK